ncbi:delta serrate ligand, partial [Opisthorchis viverrini]
MKAESGCNVHFQLCLWDESRRLTKSCNLYHGTTSEYMQMVRVADKINLRISQPVPKEYGLRIKVVGRVQLDLFRPIGSFEAPRFTIRANGNRTKVMLKRTQHGSRNPNVEITASLQLTCAPHFYGSYCQNYCKPNTSHYICNSDGQRICRYDPHCQQLVNGCNSSQCTSWDVSTTKILPVTTTQSTHRFRPYISTTTKRPSTIARQQVIHSSQSSTTEHSSTTLTSKLYKNDPGMTTHQQLIYSDSASPSYQHSATPVSEIGTQAYQEDLYIDLVPTTKPFTEISSSELDFQNSVEATHEVMGGFGATAQAAVNSLHQNHSRSVSLLQKF